MSYITLVVTVECNSMKFSSLVDVLKYSYTRNISQFGCVSSCENISKSEPCRKKLMGLKI